MAVVVVRPGEGVGMKRRWTGNQVVTDWIEWCVVEEARSLWLDDKWRQNLLVELTGVVLEGFEP